MQGSFEAIRTAVEQLGNSEVSVSVISGGVGAITDGDVNLAASSKGFILGFNMRPVTTARRLSDEKGVDIKTYSIIYELINDVTMALEGMLTPERVEKYIGRAQVKETFSIPKIGTIAGTSVIDGKIERGCNVRLLRDGKILYDGKLSTLKRFKDEVKEVKNGFECGMALENFNDIKNEDLIEAYIMEEKKRTLVSEVTL
jgi:translation initiation factor IF-2